MSSDPAVRSAAVAVLNHTPVLDALRLIALPPQDWAEAVAVLNKADRMAAEREELQAKQIAYYLAKHLRGR